MKYFFSYAVFISLFCGINTFALEPLKGSDVATVIKLTGHSWDVSSRSKKLELRINDHLKPGSVIETDAASSLILKLGNDVAIQVKPNTHFVIDLNQKVDWLVKLESGALLSAVKNPEKRKDHFRIHTHSATLGVRGTAFFVREEKGKPTYLCTCHGTVQVTGGDGKLLKEITTTHHEFPVLITDRLEKIPMDSEHNDEDVKALETTLSAGL